MINLSGKVSLFSNWHNNICIYGFQKSQPVFHNINNVDVLEKLYFGCVWNFCQTPLQLANPTQLQLVWVGVDFVFPRKEGKRKEEEGITPHLASSKRNDPTCLNFDDCVVGVWGMFGNCLEGVWQVCSGCLEGVWKVPWRFLKGVCMVSKGCPNGNLVSNDRLS